MKIAMVARASSTYDGSDSPLRTFADHPIPTRLMGKQEVGTREVKREIGGWLFEGLARSGFDVI